MTDLFETPELIPNEVQAILDTYDTLLNEYNHDEYKVLEIILSEINKVGYTFEYDLGAVAYDLKPLNQ